MCLQESVANKKANKMARASYDKPSSNRHNKKPSESSDTKMKSNKAKTESYPVTDPGLLNQTAWTNATVALEHINKVF